MSRFLINKNVIGPTKNVNINGYDVTQIFFNGVDIWKKYRDIPAVEYLSSKANCLGFMVPDSGGTAYISSGMLVSKFTYSGRLLGNFSLVSNQCQAPPGSYQNVIVFISYNDSATTENSQNMAIFSFETRASSSGEFASNTWDQSVDIMVKEGEPIVMDLIYNTTALCSYFLDFRDCFLSK